MAPSTKPSPRSDLRQFHFSLVVFYARLLMTPYQPRRFFVSATPVKYALMSARHSQLTPFLMRPVVQYFVMVLEQ
jgi:hypothetical protein